MSIEPREAAAIRVVRLLTRRWSEELGGGQIPRAMLKGMRHSAEFNRMIDMIMEGDTLSLPDLDFHPVVRRDLDGTIHSLLLLELGGDPRDYLCVDCDVEIGVGSGHCDPCANWRATGA